jgi:hypothetical protein
VIVKQPAALGGVGAALALYAIHRQVWGRRRSAGLVGISLVLTLAAIGLLAATVHARLFVFELQMARPIEWARVTSLVAQDVLGAPQRAVLYALAAPTALFLFRREPTRRHLVSWLGVGAAVVPAVLGALKQAGVYNNLAVVDLWTAMIVVPALWHTVRSGLCAGTRAGRAWGVAAAGAILIVLLACVPSKLGPTMEQWRWGRALEDRVREDVAAHRRILVTHGAAVLIRAGIREPPLDRAATVNEYELARREDLGGTLARIEARYYDRIYWFVTAYGPRIGDAVGRKYREVEVIPGDRALPGYADYVGGWQGFTREDIHVLE